MTTNAGSGLARITIISPRRRVDLALPESITVADLLPGVLRASGESAADDGQQHGGWVLRRASGALVDPTKTLAAQEVRDGELLHLTSRQSEWPELDYDDVVDAIATNARSRNRGWSGASTRTTGISLAAVFLIGGLALTVATASDWYVTGLSLLIASLVLLIIGVALSRALGDAGAGTALASIAMGYAAVGGTLLPHESEPLSALGPTQLLLGSAALLTASLIGYIGVAYETQYFVAGATVGVLGIIGSLAAQLWDLSTGDAGAVLAATVVSLMPAFPLLSIRLGKLPVPTLPTSTEELLADPPHPSLPRVHATVKRSDEILRGLFLGSSLVLAYAQYQLIVSDRLSATILVGITAVLALLRARLLPAISHRLPILAAGVQGVVLLAATAALAIAESTSVVAIPATFALVGLIALGIGIYFRSRKPTPYMSRIADIIDVIVMLAVVPVTALVVGLFGYMRGLFG